MNCPRMYRQYKKALGRNETDSSGVALRERRHSSF